MLSAFAVANFRSLLDLQLPLAALNVVTGANGSGKSNLYRALRLLAETAHGGVVPALAHDGGLASTWWAGPETLSGAMRRGEVPIQGTHRNRARRLKLGFGGEDFGYAITLGLPKPSLSAFSLDPEIKTEHVWAGASYRLASALVEREGALVRVRDGRGWRTVSQRLSIFDSIFSQLADPETAPELLRLRERMRDWRFYDHFRTDREAPARLPQLGTRTPVLHHDGRDLAAALQTIREIGDSEALDEAISDAFPGASVNVVQQGDGRFSIEFNQEGLLRPLAGGELSDGTLRYLLWVAALLTPRPPALMVLNEPETSLHPDLLPALARLIIHAAGHSQIWVVSHATRLIAALKQSRHCHAIELEKQWGQTQVKDQDLLDRPTWHWADG